MKFDHILFPTDFSERSVALNSQIEGLAAQFGSRVTLLHVFELPAAWYAAGEATFVDMECLNQIRGSARRRLEAYSIKVPETRVERFIAEGDVAGEIMDWAARHDVDLIAMGTHGYGALQGLILGSMTAKVLHAAGCPVWTSSAHMPANGFTVSKILCAVELIDEAIPLLRFARDLAQQWGASVRLIHSVPEVQTRPNRYFDFDLHRYLTESAHVELAKMQREAGTEFRVTVSGQGISDALVDAANQYGADLVVIGRGNAQKMLGRFKTHAYDIIQHAPCPVLSYSPRPLNHISSSCNAEHLSQSAEVAPLLTGSQKL